MSRKIAGAKEESIGGLQANLVAVLGYVIPILGLVFYLMEEDNDFVRHHGIHSFLYGLVATVVVSIAMFVVPVVLGILALSGGGIVNLLVMLITIVVPLSVIAMPLYFMYDAFTGGDYALFGLHFAVDAAV